MDTLKGYLNDLNMEHYRFLTIDYFTLPEFPWDRVLSSDENFNKVLSTKTSAWIFHAGEVDADFTKKILKDIGSDLMLKMLPHLTLEHLGLFPEEKLKDPQFPWSEFIKKDGIASYLHRTFRSDFLTKTSIPWVEFVDHPKEFEKLFETHRGKGGSELENRNEFTCTIFKSLDFTVVHKMLPRFTLDHLGLFPEEKLKDPQFPWSEFIEKDGIASYIHRTFLANFLIQTAIPWVEFVDHPKEFEKLFETHSGKGGSELEYRNAFTRTVLKSLDEETRKKLTLLKPEHFELLKS